MSSKPNIFTNILVSYLTIICATINYVECFCESSVRMRENATLDYLILERNLWTKISSNANAEKESLFDLVRKDHAQFLSNYGFVSTGGLYKLPSTTTLKKAVEQVYDLRIRTEYRLVRPNDLNLTDAISISGELSESARRLAGTIARELNRPDFWTNSTNVSFNFISFILIS